MGETTLFRVMAMATGWAGDGAVQDQIDATVKDAIKRVQSQLPKGIIRPCCVQSVINDL